MKLTDKDKAWEILIARKAERKENRTAFIAALIMERCTITIPVYNREDGGPSSEPAFSTFQASAFAVELVRLAGAIHHLCTAACNYELSKPQESRLENLRVRFVMLAEALGFEARTGGDPRGACAYLIDPDERKGDGWGEGWAVYA